MTEGFRSSPPPSTDSPVRTPDSSRYTQEVTDTVQRIMGEDIAPPPAPVTPPPTPTSGSDSATSTTMDVAKQQTAEVADTAKQSAAQVAGTVKEQAGQVTEEAKHQAKHLLSQAQSELSDQAASTQQRVSEGLHALADELTGMARNSEQDRGGHRPGPAGRGPGPDRGRVAGRPGPGQSAQRGAVLRPPQARHLPRARAGCGRAGRPVDPRPDRAHHAAPAGSATSTGLASTRTTFPAQFDGSEPLTDPFGGAPITTVTGYETGADPAPRAVPVDTASLDSIGTPHR